MHARAFCFLIISGNICGETFYGGFVGWNVLSLIHLTPLNCNLPPRTSRVTPVPSPLCILLEHRGEIINILLVVSGMYLDYISDRNLWSTLHAQATCLRNRILIKCSTMLLSPVQGVNLNCPKNSPFGTNRDRNEKRPSKLGIEQANMVPVILKQHIY